MKVVSLLLNNFEKILHFIAAVKMLNAAIIIVMGKKFPSHMISLLKNNQNFNNKNALKGTMLLELGENL